jgi:hypothetical protein
MNYFFLKKYDLLRALNSFTSFFLVSLLIACGAASDSSSTATNVPALKLSIIDASGGTVSSVVVGASYTLRAVVSQTGGAAGNEIVTFAAGGLGTLSPSSGTALTNSSGLATVTFVPNAAGAATATANATVNKVTTTTATSTTPASTTTTRVPVTSSYNYSVTSGAPAAISLGALAVTSSTLVSGGTAVVSVEVFGNGMLAKTTPTAVSFTASCGQITPNIVTSDGNARAAATYSAVTALGDLCSGSVALTASAAGITSQNTITVSSPVTGAITFVSASPNQIFLNSTGASSQSTLTFKVLGPTGSPLPNWPIDFTITGNPGGVTFGTLGNTSLVNKNSDSTGTVAISVFAGGTPGSVTIKAEWQNNSTIFTTSNNFTVSSGPPQQSRLSLAVSTYNIEGWTVDGVPTTITATLADANGNPVPDGTVINFVTDGGTINRSCSTTTANAGGLNPSGFSRCSVTLISSNPRPRAGTSSSGAPSVYPTNGRVHVLAYLEGIKTYRDGAGGTANLFDAGIDIVTDQGDAYRDDNENNQYDVGEFAVVKGGMASCVNPATGGNPQLEINISGTAGASTPSRANTCTGANTLATTVRGQVHIAFSSNVPNVNNFSAVSGSGSFRLNGLMQSADGTFSSLLPMPATTSITGKSSATTCTIAVTPATVSNTSIGGVPLTNYGTPHNFTATGTGCSGSTFTIETTSPSGLIRTASTSFVLP